MCCSSAFPMQAGSGCSLRCVQVCTTNTDDINSQELGSWVAAASVTDWMGGKELGLEQQGISPS